jgi:predicted dehydrogenase
MTSAERVVLVGTGGFGETWWPALAEAADRLEVVAVVDPDHMSRDKAAERFGVTPGYTAASLDRGLLQAVGATVVIDSSPAVHRRTHAQMSLERGIHMLVAKPLGLSWADASDIVAASRAGGSVAVAQQMRYFPCFLALRRMLAESRHGPVVSVSVEMALDGRGWAPGTQWRLDMEHPLLMEAGIHHFDLLRWCLGTELRVVGGVEWNPPWSPFRTGSSVSILLQTSDGAPVAYNATFAPSAHAAPVRFDSGWRIECADACLNVTDGAIHVDGVLSGPGPSEGPVPLEDLNRELLAEWLTARDAGVPSPFDGVDNLRSMAVLQEAVKAVQSEAGARASESEL